MHELSNLLELLYKLQERGGPVILVIMVLSFAMWILIFERYLYLYVDHPKKVRAIVDEWMERTDHSSWYAHRIRDGLVSEVKNSLYHFLSTIRTLTAILPLLGLLGTVTGMITTFDVITVFGTGNARGLASGISTALITTTAGLVTSLAGLYFSSNLEHMAEIEIHRTADKLV
jgi:biopolymer transport protein ExbB